MDYPTFLHLGLVLCPSQILTTLVMRLCVRDWTGPSSFTPSRHRRPSPPIWSPSLIFTFFNPLNARSYECGAGSSSCPYSPALSLVRPPPAPSAQVVNPIIHRFFDDFMDGISQSSVTLIEADKQPTLADYSFDGVVPDILASFVKNWNPQYDVAPFSRYNTLQLSHLSASLRA